MSEYPSEKKSNWDDQPIRVKKNKEQLSEFPTKKQNDWDDQPVGVKKNN